MAAVVDPAGRLLDTKALAASTRGCVALVTWAEGLGPVERIGIAGTGTDGAGLARFACASGLQVLESTAPTAAPAADRATPTRSTPRPPPGPPWLGWPPPPKTRDGQVEMIWVLGVARRGALKARVAAAEQLHDVRSSAPEELRQPLLNLKTKTLVGICAAMRPRPLTSTTAATKTSLRTLARRWQQLQAELDQLDGQLQELVATAAPTLLALPGVGVDTAGQPHGGAGDNPSGSALRPPSPTCAAPRPSPRPRPHRPSPAESGW